MRCIPVAEARSHLSRIVEQASSAQERFDITRNGSRAAALLSANDYDALMETLEILSDSQLVKEIGKGLEGLESGDTLTVGQVRDDMKNSG